VPADLLALNSAVQLNEAVLPTAASSALSEAN